MKLDATIPTSPLVDAVGNIRPEWRAFFTGLWLRTGGAVGVSSDTTELEAQLAAETTARQQGDAGLGSALLQETYTRSTTDSTLTQALQQETAARQSADAALVPQAQLCSLWAQCNLAFLPTADPGHGQPWLNDNVLCVGTSTSTMTGMLLEDGTGDWMLEAGGAGNDWAWG